MSVEEQAGFSPRNAVFVCNKWDRIPPQEQEDDVKSYVSEKLRKCWPDIDSDRQIIYLSTKNALHALQSCNVVNNDFSTLLSSITTLLINSMQARLLVSWKWLDLLLARIEFYAKMFLQFSARDKKEGAKKLVIFLAKLIKLKKDHQATMEDLKKQMDLSVSKAIDQLGDYLRSVVTDLCQWNIEDVPPIESSWKLTERSVKNHIIRRLKNCIEDWEEREEVFAKSRESLKNSVLQKYNIFEVELQNLETDVVTSNNSHKVRQKVYADLDNDGLSVRTKVILGVTAPLWVPLGIAALVLGAPVLGVISIGEKINENRRFREYKTDPCKFMEKETERIIENVLSAALVPFVKKQMEDANLCLKQIEAQIINLINLDTKLFEDLLDETSKQANTRALYEPMLRRAEKLRGILGMFFIREISSPELDGGLVEWEEDSKHVLGRGAFSTVYRGILQLKNKSGAIDIAVKAYNEVLTQNNVVEFLAEEDALRKLQHQNIVQFYGSIFRKSDDEQVCTYLVMEMCKESLKRSSIKNIPSKSGSPQAKQQVSIWLKEIMAAVSYIHEKGFIHRDLKLDNILVTDDGHIKVTDVGLAKLEQDITGTVCGTPVCMAPEVWDQKVYSTRADIYSLGIIMWEMWYGRQAFQELADEPFYQFFELVKRGYRPVVPLPDETAPPDWWRGLMEQCWEKNPDKRPTASECFTVVAKVEV